MNRKKKLTATLTFSAGRGTSERKKRHDVQNCDDKNTETPYIRKNRKDHPLKKHGDMNQKVFRIVFSSWFLPPLSYSLITLVLLLSLCLCLSVSLTSSTHQKKTRNKNSTLSLSLSLSNFTHTDYITSRHHLLHVYITHIDR